MGVFAGSRKRKELEQEKEQEEEQKVEKKDEEGEDNVYEKETDDE